MKKNETALVASVLGVLHARGVFAWRVNAGLTFFAASGTHAKRVIKGAPNGTPDIIGVLPGGSGRMFGIECKSPKGKQNPNQIAWQKKAEAHGVRYGVARSVLDATNLLEAWKVTPPAERSELPELRQG